MFPPNSPESYDSDLVYVKQSSNGPSPPRPNTPIVLNSTEMSGNNTREMITKASIAPPGPQIVTIDSDSKKPQCHMDGFGRQLLIIPASLNDPNLPPNPSNILAIMVVATTTAEGDYEN